MFALFLARALAQDARVGVSGHGGHRARSPVSRARLGVTDVTLDVTLGPFVVVARRVMRERHHSVSQSLIRHPRDGGIDRWKVRSIVDSDRWKVRSIGVEGRSVGRSVSMSIAIDSIRFDSIRFDSIDRFDRSIDRCRHRRTHSIDRLESG